eukprot:m.66470 g.66470  ORF g.66470 m.66470 type:complete len:640 (-) comp13593_c2_seq1:37-1956(-)
MSENDIELRTHLLGHQDGDGIDGHQENNYDSPPSSPSTTDATHEVFSAGEMDEFCRRFYHYFRKRGWLNILLNLIFDMLKVLFLFLLVLFVALCVDFVALSRMISNLNNPRDECAGNPSLFGRDCDDNQPIHFQRLAKPSPDVLAVLFIFLIMWTFMLLRRLRVVRGLLNMKHFYEKILGVDNAQLQTVPWSLLEDKLIAAFNDRRIRFMQHPSHLNGWMVRAIIMRKKNGLIRLYSDILHLDPTMPGLSCFVGKSKTQYLPRILHIVLSKLIDSTIFKTENGVSVLRKEVREDPARVSRHLRLWLRVVGLCMFIFSPFVLLYNAADFSFRNSDLLRNSPGTFAVRQWTFYATWYFRGYNELDHYCARRLHQAYKPTKSYLDSYVSFTLANVARFLQFIAGGLFAMLFFLTVYYDEDFLRVEVIGDRSVAWCLAALAAVLGLLRGWASEDVEVQTPRKHWNDAKEYLVIHQHEWDANPTHPDSYAAIGRLFNFRLVAALGELLGIVLAPLYLMFKLPSQAPQIVMYYVNNFREVKELGDHERHVIASDSLMRTLVARKSDIEASLTSSRLVPAHLVTQSTYVPLDGSQTAASTQDLASSQQHGTEAADDLDEEPDDHRSRQSRRLLETDRLRESVLYTL